MMTAKIAIDLTNKFASGAPSEAAPFFLHWATNCIKKRRTKQLIKKKLILPLKERLPGLISSVDEADA
ncbi:hypothetical protein [Candidatus Erwinia dacicola]|nr:hypothetical protein [Candidatus Erwinia dacicola]OFC61562.1 hypothetical protein BBW68_12390 [Candidatus Erwinia dacicola]